MPTLAAARAANAATKLPFKPVALFVGGTSGIGQGAAEVFARYTEGNADIFICGRNETAAKKIIASFPKHPSAKHEFLHCDVKLMSNVTAACTELREKHGITKLNYLFLCQGAVELITKWTDNGEGIDKRGVTFFYSRFKFVIELLPLLEAAKAAGEEARVVSVLNAGRGAPIDITDIGAKKVTSIGQLIKGGATRNSLAVEAFAEEYSNMSFTHLYPGYVSTSFGKNVLPVRIVLALLSLNPFGPKHMNIQECGEWMMRPLFDPTMTSGAFHLDEFAESIPRAKLYVDEPAGAKAAMYNHLVETLGAPTPA